MLVSLGGMDVLNARKVTVVPNMIANAGARWVRWRKYLRFLSRIRVDKSQTVDLILRWNGQLEGRLLQ